MPAFGNRVSTTVQDKIMAKVVDSVLNSNVLATRFLSAAKQWSGETMKFPLKYQKNSTGSSFSGFDSLSTAASNTRVNLAFNPSFYSIAVTLPLDELAVNATDSRVIDLMAVETASSAQDMADDIGTQFYGDGTGNSSKDFLGLGAIVDDGSSVATYGGLSRSTYPTIQATVTASSGTLSLAKLRTLYNAVTSGSQKPTAAFTTESVFGYYEQLLQPQERILKDVGMAKGLSSGTGFTALSYSGVPVLMDEKCTSGQFIFLNEDFIDFYALPMPNTKQVKFKSSDIEGNDYSDVMGLGFSWSDWIVPTNQASLIGHIYLGGQFIGYNPKRNGKLTGITGV